MVEKTKVIIMGSAGRDFHNFNSYFRDNPKYEVVAFTAATQVPGIAGRDYPPVLSGSLYPDGIHIYPVEELPQLIKKHNVEEVVLSYSDLLGEEVVELASEVLALGAKFSMLGTDQTQFKSEKPVVAITATRTGAGKSTTTRAVVDAIRAKGLKPVAVRHPMPYGDLAKQIVQRYEKLEDLDKYNCTFEEREEYEPLIRKGVLLYAGVDYEKILREVEKEADVVVWDGGNNDFPFFKTDYMLVVADPLRPGHELKSYPGRVNALNADAFVINKVNVAEKKDVETVKKNLKKVNPDAEIIEAKSVVSVDKPELIKGRRVLAVEDGPTVTHGGLPFAAAYVAAQDYGAKEIVDARPAAVGSIKKTFEMYPHMKNVLPSEGYGKKQMDELEKTINAVDCDSVIFATPVGRNLDINKPKVTVTFELEEIGHPTVAEVLEELLEKA